MARNDGISGLVGLAVAGGVAYWLWKNNILSSLTTPTIPNTNIPSTNTTNIPAGASAGGVNPSPVSTIPVATNPVSTTPTQQPSAMPNQPATSSPVQVPAGASTGTTPAAIPVNASSGNPMNRQQMIYNNLANLLHQGYGWTLQPGGAALSYDQWSSLLQSAGAAGSAPTPEDLGLTGEIRWNTMDFDTYNTWLSRSGRQWWAL